MKKAKNHTGPRYDVYLDYYGGFMWKARVFQGNYLLTSFDAFSRKGAIRKAKRHVSRIRKNDRYKAQNSNHLML